MAKQILIKKLKALRDGRFSAEKVVKVLFGGWALIATPAVTVLLYQSFADVHRVLDEIHYLKIESNIDSIISNTEDGMALLPDASERSVNNGNRTLYSVVKYNIENNPRDILAKHIKKHNNFSFYGCLSEVDNWKITKSTTLNDIKALKESMQETCPRLAGFSIIEETFPEY